VAQRISTVLKADKIIVIDEGRIAAEGTHRGLRRVPSIRDLRFTAGNGFRPEEAGSNGWGGRMSSQPSRDDTSSIAPRMRAAGGCRQDRESARSAQRVDSPAALLEAFTALVIVCVCGDLHLPVWWVRI
jgi:hypothetical protein